jgi:hypothetical protein
VRVTKVFVYPIKSCRGVAMRSARLSERGLENDRRWMIVDERGRFLSQRELPELSLVNVAIDGAELVVTAAGAAPLQLPRELSSGTRRAVTVWRDSVGAVVHLRGSAWFSALLSRACQLVFMPDDERRAVNPARARPSDIVSFADGYPLLLVSEASLLDLSARAGVPLEVDRFRPNVVIDGSEPFAEERWPAVRLGEVRYRAPKGCDRCVVTTVDPRSGLKGKEPLATLATYRKREGKVWFGVNLIHDELGTLAVGDAVTPLF